MYSAPDMRRLQNSLRLRCCQVLIALIADQVR